MASLDRSRRGPWRWREKAQKRVTLFAAVPGVERFQDLLDNAEVPTILRELLGW